MHGFACTHEDWHFQFEEFRKRREVLACDLRGHGATPGRAHECSIEHYGGDVAALLASLDIPKAVLVGHSMGCRVVLEANRLAPERVAGIVLIDGSRLGSGDPDAAEAAARAAIERVGYSAFAEDLFRQMFLRPSPQADAIVERALRTSAAFGADLWVRMARWSAVMHDAALDAVRAPLLAIQSTMLDAAMRRVAMREGETNPWLESLKDRGARVEIVPDTGHFTMLEAPERVNELIGAFVARL